MREQSETPTGGKNRAFATIQEVRTIETAWMKQRKEYIKEHNLHTLLGEAMDSCIERQVGELPEEPLVFISEYLLRRYLQDKDKKPRPKSLEHLKGLQRTLDTFISTLEESASEGEVCTPPLIREVSTSSLGNGSTPNKTDLSSPSGVESDAVPLRPSILSQKKPNFATPLAMPAEEPEDIDTAQLVTSDDAEVEDQEAPTIPQLARGSISFVAKREPRERKQSTAQDWEEVISSPAGRRLWYNKKLHKKTWEKPCEVVEIERDSSPVDWLEVKGTHSQKWYFNTKTGMKQWHKPSELKDGSCPPVSAGGTSEGPIVTRELDYGWTEHVPRSGLSFYTHSKHGSKQYWSKPQEVTDPLLKGTGWQEYDYQGVSYYVNDNLNVCSI